MLNQTIAAIYSRTCVKWTLLKKRKLIFKTNYRFMQVKILQNAPRGASCNTFDLRLATFCHLDLCFVFFEWPLYTGITVMRFPVHC